MTRFALGVLGADRPGIVAGVTKVLFEQGCTLADSSMTILTDHFAMMLVIDGPPESSVESLEGALVATARKLDLVVTVRAVPAPVDTHTAGAPYILSVYGADQPGIVYRFAALLAAEEVNITDLNTRVIGDPKDPVYAMLLEVTVPGSVDRDHLESELGALAEDLCVEANLHPADIDIL